jgi:allantoinase
VVVIRSTRVVLPDGARPAAIHIEASTITHVAAHDDVPAGAEVIDAGSLAVSPGIVDTHVHVNEPGRTEWEGFDTATCAAAAGGVTTIVDMPLNSIPATTTAEALDAKRRAASGRCHVDVAFWGGVVPGNDHHLDALVEAGVRGFKCFLVPSGVDEFPAVDEDDLRRAMPILARHDVPLLVHAESPAVLEAARSPKGSRSTQREWSARLQPSGSDYGEYLATRPPEAEVEAIRTIVRLAREFGVRAHIVHVASAEAVAGIERAKSEGVPITAETCPHYLTFAAEEIPDGATEFKCAPPIRESRHRDALWDGLKRGVLDLIATDHSPAPPALKCPGDFMRAWGGIASLEISLPSVWTAGQQRSTLESQLSEQLKVESSQLRVDLSAIAHWMSERPAALAGLGRRKGRIAVGYDADLIVWDPDAEFTVDASRLQHRHKITPYAGRRLRGRVRTTLVRGERVWDDAELVRASSGQLL